MAINTKWTVEQRRITRRIHHKQSQQAHCFKRWHILDAEISILKAKRREVKG